MNKNRKIIIITAILITTLTLTLPSVISAKVASGNASVYLAIKEIDSAPIGETYVSLSDQSFTNLPSILNGMKEADKIFNHNIVRCNVPCAPSSHAQSRPDSYTTSIGPIEANLALSVMGFHDIPRPGQITVDIHGTVVEYDGKYYSIVIMGI